MHIHRESELLQISPSWDLRGTKASQEESMLDEYVMEFPGIQNNKLTSWKRNVSKNVCSLVTSGRTAKEVSPTSPRVTLLRASWFTGRPKRGATIFQVSGSGIEQADACILTRNQCPIHERVHGPNVWRPVRMAQPSRERKEATLEL